MEGFARAAGMGGRMMGGGFMAFGLLLFILVVVAVVLAVVRRRRMKAYLAGNYKGRAPEPFFARPEMTKEQAARIVIASLKQRGVTEADIRSRLLTDYQMEPLMADALLIEVKPAQ